MRDLDIKVLLPAAIQDAENVRRIRTSVLSENEVSVRDDALLELTEKLLGEWYLDEAIETIAYIEEILGHKASALAGIARRYRQLGSSDRARELLVSAAEIARLLPSRLEAAYTLVGIAEHAQGAMSSEARAELLVEARDAALEAHNHGDQQDSVDAAKILATIAVGLTLLRRDREAELCANSIKYKQYRASARSRIRSIERHRESA